MMKKSKIITYQLRLSLFTCEFTYFARYTVMILTDYWNNYEGCVSKPSKFFFISCYEMVKLLQ
jgi:hypothetical protein